MKLTTGLIIAVVFIVGCLTGGATSSFVVPKVRAGTNPQKWEYICSKPFNVAKEIQGHSNKLGRQGWEMATTGFNGRVWCFKRPL